MKRWNKKQIRGIEQSMELWQKIAALEGYDFSEGLIYFKNRILKELGLGHMDFGCPLCQLYRKKDCKGCPITIELGSDEPVACGNTPYGEFHNAYLEEDEGLCRKASLEFLEYLIKLRGGFPNYVMNLIKLVSAQDQLIQRYREIVEADEKIILEHQKIESLLEAKLKDSYGH